MKIVDHLISGLALLLVILMFACFWLQWFWPEIAVLSSALVYIAFLLR